MTSARLREEVGIRRRQLVDASIRALGEFGAGRISVRLIAAEAGVSPGLITHHFTSVEKLIAAAADHLGDSFLGALDKASALGGHHPRDRFTAFVASCFRLPALSPRRVSAWLAIVALARSMQVVADSHAQVRGRFNRRLCELLTAVGDPGHPKAALAIAATIEGFWMEIARGSELLTYESAEMLTFQCCRNLGVRLDPA